MGKAVNIIGHTGGPEFLIGSVNKMVVVNYLDSVSMSDGTSSGEDLCVVREAESSGGKDCAAGDKGCRGGRGLMEESCNKVGLLAGADVITVLDMYVIVRFDDRGGWVVRGGRWFVAHPRRWRGHTRRSVTNRNNL